MKRYTTIGACAVKRLVCFLHLSLITRVKCDVWIKFQDNVQPQKLNPFGSSGTHALNSVHVSVHGFQLTCVLFVGCTWCPQRANSLLFTLLSTSLTQQRNRTWTMHGPYSEMVWAKLLWKGDLLLFLVFLGIILIVVFLLYVGNLWKFLNKTITSFSYFVKSWVRLIVPWHTWCFCFVLPLFIYCSLYYF